MFYFQLSRCFLRKFYTTGSKGVNLIKYKPLLILRLTKKIL